MQGILPRDPVGEDWSRGTLVTSYLLKCEFPDSKAEGWTLARGKYRGSMGTAVTIPNMTSLNVMWTDNRTRLNVKQPGQEPQLSRNIPVDGRQYYHCYFHCGTFIICLQVSPMMVVRSAR